MRGFGVRVRVRVSVRVRVRVRVREFMSKSVSRSVGIRFECTQEGWGLGPI